MKKPRRRFTSFEIEPLEIRALLTSIVGLASDNTLVKFDSATPGTLIGSPVAITGLQVSETIVSMDFRPADGTLVGVGSTNKLYTIDPNTGAATIIGTGFATTLTGAAFGSDFNPVTDRMRVVSDADQNIRLNPNDGTLAATDTNLTYAVGDPNAAANPSVVGIAYSNNVLGALSTTFYGIDSGLDILNTTANPNTGQLTTIGALGVDTTTDAGFDIDADGNVFASLTPNASSTSNLYTIDLTTGAATLVGAIGATTTLRDIAVSLSGTLAFSAPTYSVAETGSTATITINRTNGSAGAITVNFATSDGTATAGNDYTAVTTPVSFAAGQASKTVDIPILDDNANEGDETVNLTLSAPSGAAVLGTQSTATLTIVDDEAAAALPTVQFSAPTYSVSESGTNATVTVTRTGSLLNTSSVSFATSDNTATAGADYTAVTTTVNFAAGENSKTVNIPITNDTTDEPDETVNLTLTAPTGATLGTQSTAVLTIQDDDPGARTEADLINPKKNVLVISGTAGADTIRVNRRPGNNIEAIVNGTSQGVFSKIFRMIIRAGDGNDLVRLGPAVLQSAEIHGENGDDVLIGGAGRDIIIGAAGRDVLFGRAGDDILIGGNTTLDNDQTGMASIAAVWLGKGSAAKRSAAIQTGVGVSGGFKFNNTTISDDSQVDVLTGDNGFDLIFNSATDILPDEDSKDLPVVI